MKTLYRITDIESTNPSPIYQDDKPRLNRLCLESFVRAFDGVPMDITFLCDYCGIDTVNMIKELCPNATVIETQIGINETMIKAYDIAYAQDEDIFFVECDYYWREGTGQAFIDGLNEISLVSPYDHKNFYIDKTLHSNQVMIKLVDDTHWRSTERNTMTFAIKNSVFKKHIERFKHWGYLDSNIWYEMLEKGYPLWVPIPSFSTHMVRDYLAPSINWEQLWKIQI